MPATVQWYIKDHVLYTTYSGKLTVEDFEYATAEMLRMMEKSPAGTVHALVDCHGITKFPPNFLTVARALQPLSEHRKTGWGIAFGTEDSFMRYTVNMIGNLMKNNSRMVDTKNDAVQFLHEVDPSLAELAPDEIFAAK